MNAGARMKIDLQKDAVVLAKSIADRVTDYPVYVNAGPGKDEDQITLITLGYQFDQAGWVALVFDTRPDAQVDGEWQFYIKENVVPFDRWFKAFDNMVDRRSKLSITLHNGKIRSFTADSEQDDVAECFRLMCRAALQKAKSGVFKKLPLAKDCRLSVEDHDGFYGWTSGKKVKDLRQIVREAVLHAAKKLSKSRATVYWIDQLERVASSAPATDSSGHVDNMRDVEQALDELAAIGPSTFVPLMEFAIRWARRPRFRLIADEAQEQPISTVLSDLFQKLIDLKWADPKAEPLIQRFIREAIKAPPVFTKSYPDGLFGRAPYDAGQLLHANYEGYPWARDALDGDKFINAEHFTGKKPARK
jgi:hypothetical protein